VSAQPIWSKWWKWSECSLSVALSVWKDVCIYFNTVALSVVTLICCDGIWLGGEYCLMSTWRAVQGSQLKAVFRRSGGDRKCRLESAQTLFSGLNYNLWTRSWNMKVRGNRLTGIKLMILSIQTSRKVQRMRIRHPLNGMNAAKGGNLLSLWMFIGWL